jgi:DNA invertase Pin-like site-specific DNA recombinase
MVQILSALAELEAKMTRKRVQQGIAARQAADDDYKHGRAPIGLQKDDGHLAPADDFRHVQEMLLKVDQDEMSQREAASRLDCGRKTIRRHLRNSRELYELPPAEESQYLG